MAEEAYALVAPHETVFFDASTATFLLARLIRQRGLRLRVVTNSLPVVNELADSEVEVIAIGGTFRQVTQSFTGPAAVRAVRDLFADRCVLSAASVTERGVLTEDDWLEAEVKRSMLAQSDRSLLILEQPTLQTHGRHVIASIQEMTDVVADGVDVTRWRDAGRAGARRQFM